VRRVSVSGVVLALPLTLYLLILAHFASPFRRSQAQATAGYDGKLQTLEAKGRHDPCVLPRAPPLVEAMAALVLADAALIQRSRGVPIHVLPEEEGESDGGAAEAY